MSFIDKNMYENLKGWCDWTEGKRLKNEYVMYVNSHDRELTNATIRKMMFEMRREDIHGETLMAFYSAENFYRNMREYYTHIADLYMHKPTEDGVLLDIIGDLPPTCGWIVLIVEGIELLSDKAKEMQEMIEAVFEFSSKRPSIILVGTGDYKKVFAGCEFAMNKMIAGIEAKEDNLVMVRCFNQEDNPIKENVKYTTSDDQLDELNFYWGILYKQLERRYFDYVSFKNLYKEMLEYIVPRVTLEQIYRKDISLVENIGAMRKENNEHLDGCDPWEFDAAQEFSKGLYKAIINRYGNHDNINEEKTGIEVEIKKRVEDFGVIHISGSTYTTIMVNMDTVSCKMDKLSDTIREYTYGGDGARLWQYLNEKYVEQNGLKKVPRERDEVGNKLISLMDNIKEAADRTVNREPGRKVRRYKGNTGENT